MTPGYEADIWTRRHPLRWYAIAWRLALLPFVAVLLLALAIAVLVADGIRQDYCNVSKP